MAGWTMLDWVLVLIVLLSVLQAIAQGFVHEFFALAGVIVGYLLAAWEYPRLAAWYQPHVNSAWAADLAGFFTIFFLVLLLAGVLGRIVRWAVHGVGLRWFDRLLGGLFGFLRGFAVSAVIILAMAAFAPQWGWLQQSRLAPFLLVSGRGLIWAAPGSLQQRFRDGWELLRTVPEHVSDHKEGSGER